MTLSATSEQNVRHKLDNEVYLEKRVKEANIEVSIDMCNGSIHL